MLSAEQINQYLEAADHILDQAIETRSDPGTKSYEFDLHRYNLDSWKSFRRKIERQKREYDSLTKRAKERADEEIARFEEAPYSEYKFPVVENGEVRAPKPGDEDQEGIDGLIPTHYKGDIATTREVMRVRVPGWYRVRVTAYAVKNEGKPVRMEVAYGSFGQADVPKIADVVQLHDDTPRDYEYTVYLGNGESVRVAMMDGPNWAKSYNKADLPGPFVAIESIEIEGPVYEMWPPKGHQALLGNRNPNKLSDDEMPTILSDLAVKLFRRPVDRSVMADFVAYYNEARQHDLDELAAFRLTAKAMLASPFFVYHVEPGTSTKDSIDQYALANRLSYFLWRSCPDEELLQLAASNQLSNRSLLASQVDRMLADPKSERFLKDFIGQWLGINEVGEMKPDKHLYPEYDDPLERAMIAETEGFIREMLRNDLDLLNLIDSDWAILNDRLAKHYGIEGVAGIEFRKVSLAGKQTVRGGLLTQASILNLTSNGTTTSPVVRGVWILDRLLGTPPPPPPPDVPAIEPDIRGASTIQEQLELHRSIAQCGSCHRKIDPYGFALENFDVIGGWREKYRALEPTRNPKRPNLVDGPEVISTDKLPAYGEFDDFEEFRQLLKLQEENLQENVARQLATFGLGRTMEFADEEQIIKIADRTRSQGSGLRTMIREVILSDLFLRP